MRLLIEIVGAESLYSKRPLRFWKPDRSVKYLFFLWAFHNKILHEFCRIVSGDVIGMVHQLPVKRNGGFNAFDDELIQGAFHFVDSLLTSLGSSDQFRDHRIVMRWYNIPGINMGIQPYPMPAGGVQGCDLTG